MGICRLLAYSALAGMAATFAACKPPAEQSTNSVAPPESTGTVATATSSPPQDVATALTAHSWQLVTATDAQGQAIGALFPAPDRPMGLSFADGRVNVAGGCNRMGGAYTLTADQLEVGQMMSTMMACPPALAAADKAMSGTLSGTLTAAIEGGAEAPMLRLVDANGNTLVLRGTPTPETRFGGPGTRAFLEVSAQRGPCGEGFPADRTCLQVRDRAFDEAGLAVGEPGAWRPLTREIEGYTPTDGERQVLRLKRFERPAAAGGEPEVHLVLDMIVERERVAP